jgi:chromosome segregation ATPase
MGITINGWRAPVLTISLAGLIGIGAGLVSAGAWQGRTEAALATLRERIEEKVTSLGRELDLRVSHIQGSVAELKGTMDATSHWRQDTTQRLAELRVVLDGIQATIREHEERLRVLEGRRIERRIEPGE